MKWRTRTAVLDAIWITDDLLVETYRRFVKTSSHYNCRRHGSHVPGPLEARRRQARRRIGLVAGTGASLAPFDLGALLGLNARPPVEWETSWKWEAPTIRPAPSSPPSPPFLSKLLKIPRMPVEDTVSCTATVQKATTIPSSGENSQDFGQMLKSLSHSEQINKSQMQDMIDFLQSSADENQSGNLQTLCQWLEDKAVENDALMAFAQMIKDKVKLQTIQTKEFCQAWLLLVRRGEPDLVTCLAEILDVTPEEKTRKQIIAQMSTAMFDSGSADLELLHFVLQVLHASQIMKSLPRKHPLWQPIYQEISARMSPARLHFHFENMNQVEISEILLHYWVPKYIEPRRRLKVLNALQSAGDPLSSKKMVLPPLTLVGILNWLNYLNKLPYAELLRDMFDLLLALDRKAEVWFFFKSVTRFLKYRIPHDVAVSLLEYFMKDRDSTDDLLRAWTIFHQVDSISALQFVDLPLRLIDHGYGTPERIFAILNRQVATDIVAPESRQLHNLSLTPRHIELAHVIGYAWASQKNVSSRIAFRRVWELFHFLRDRRAPLTPLMSRSLVKAGIIQPLKEKKGMAFQQSKYILSIVHRIEGEDMARALDKILYAIRNNELEVRDLHLPSLSTLFGEQQLKKMQQATLLKLKRKIKTLYGVKRAGLTTTKPWAKNWSKLYEKHKLIHNWAENTIRGSMLADSAEEHVWRQYIDDETQWTAPRSPKDDLFKHHDECSESITATEALYRDN